MLGQDPLVLVVDDYVDAREIYAEFLELCGFRVAQAEDGAAAVRMAGELLPDVILMDMSLPILDGWAASERLKQNPRTAHIPIVALTGHSFPGHPGEAPCESYLLKPCSPDDMVAEVRRVLVAAAPAAVQPGKEAR